MQHLTHVLFSVTEQPLYAAALRWVAGIVDDAEGTLRVQDVIRPFADRHRHLEIDGHDVDLQPLIVDELTHEWRTAVTRALERDDVDVVVHTGHRVRETIAETQRTDTDLLVRGELPAPAPISPLTLRLVRESPVPVLVARPDGVVHGPILAAVEVGTDHDDDLGVAVLEVAAALARSHGVPLHVVHAWDVPEERVLRGSTFINMDDAAVDRLLRDVREADRAGLEALLETADLQMLTPSRHLVRGQPVDAITTIARKVDAEVIVIGTVGRRGLARLVLGNTAEGVLQSVEASVLAVKPVDEGS